MRGVAGSFFATAGLGFSTGLAAVFVAVGVVFATEVALAAVLGFSAGGIALTEESIGRPVTESYSRPLTVIVLCGAMCQFPRRFSH